VSVPEEFCDDCSSHFAYYTSGKDYAALHRNLEAVLENTPQLILRAVVLRPKLATGGFKVLGINTFFGSCVQPVHHCRRRSIASCSFLGWSEWIPLIWSVISLALVSPLATADRSAFDARVPDFRWTPKIPLFIAEVCGVGTAQFLRNE
jgi:ABC-type Co2+ transport system permease subunit